MQRKQEKKINNDESFILSATAPETIVAAAAANIA